MGWRYESSTDAQANIFKALPMGYLFMFIITILLFNSIRVPLTIWFCVPLALIGVSTGLLVMKLRIQLYGTARIFESVGDDGGKTALYWRIKLTMNSIKEPKSTRQFLIPQ